MNLKKADNLLKDKAFDKALKSYIKIGAWMSAGFVLHHVMEDYDKALEYYEKAGCNSSLYYSGNIHYLYKGDEATADMFWQKSIKGDDPSILCLIWLMQCYREGMVYDIDTILADDIENRLNLIGEKAIQEHIDKFTKNF